MDPSISSYQPQELSVLALTDEENSCSLKSAKELLPSGFFLSIIQFLAKSDQFNDILFDEDILKTTKTLNWWKSQQNVDAIQKVLSTSKQLLSATAFSASDKSVFDIWFGTSQISNSFEIEKAAKLVILYKYYNWFLTHIFSGYTE